MGKCGCNKIRNQKCFNGRLIYNTVIHSKYKQRITWKHMTFTVSFCMLVWILTRLSKCKQNGSPNNTIQNAKIVLVVLTVDTHTHTNKACEYSVGLFVECLLRKCVSSFCHLWWLLIMYNVCQNKWFWYVYWVFKVWHLEETFLCSGYTDELVSEEQGFHLVRESHIASQRLSVRTVTSEKNKLTL